MYENWQKSGSARNAIIPKQRKILNANLDSKISKPASRLCENFITVSPENTEKETVKERLCRTALEAKLQTFSMKIVEKSESTAGNPQGCLL